jgi:hypothetical protein
VTDWNAVLDQAQANLSAWIARGCPAPYTPIQLPERVPFTPAPIVAPPPPAPRARAPRGPDKQPRRSHKSLSDLLDNVEEAFEAASLPIEQRDFVIARETLLGLRRIGPWVPYGSPWNDEHMAAARAALDWSAVDHWPALFYLSRGEKSVHKDGIDDKQLGPFGTIAAAYGLRLQKAPYDVRTKMPGPVYEFGMAYRYHGKLQWIRAYIGIDAAAHGFFACQELRLHTIHVHNRNRDQYTRKEWTVPAAFGFLADSQEQRQKLLLDTFTAVLGWWMKREERWTVSVRKGKQRVTFSIEQRDTAYFFKDRDKTARAADGKAKRIIHYVREHDRTYQTGTVATVHEHIRGLRVFDWRGYACAVTAPKFHSFNLHQFDVPALSDLRPHAKDLVDVSEFAGVLAETEDTQRAPARYQKGTPPPC